MKNVLKEFIFGVLFLAVVIMMIGILFYEFIPTKVTPESAKYAQNQTTESLIAEIEKEQDSSKDVGFKTYELAKADVEVPETTTSSTEYDQGKNNPFYDYTKETQKENQATTEQETKVEEDVTPEPEVKNEPEVKQEENTQQTIEVSNNQETKKPETSNSNTDSKPANTNNLRDTSSSAKTSK